MKLAELSTKADFIAGQQQRLDQQWHAYCNTLIQGITLSKLHLNQSIGSHHDSGLRFWLFDYFALDISLAPGFGSREVRYELVCRDSGDSLLVAQTTLSEHGLLDGGIDATDRQAVLEHYLAKIGPVYDHLFEAMQQGLPVPSVKALQVRL